MKQSREQDARHDGTIRQGVPVHPEDAEQITSLSFDIETVLSRKDMVIQEPIPGGGRGAVVTIRAEAQQPSSLSSPSLRFQLRGYQFPDIRRGMMEKPDYHFEIRRKHFGRTQETWVVVYRSAADEGNLNPTWETDDISLSELCQDNLDGQVQIKVWDVDKVGYWSALGMVETSVRSMMEAQCRFGNLTRENGFPLTRDGKAKRGEIVVVRADVVQPSEDLAVATPVPADATTITTASTFMSSSMTSSTAMSRGPPPLVADASVLPASTLTPIPPPTTPTARSTEDRLRSFIGLTRNGRCNVDLCVAIDFTDANGDFRQPSSSHFRTSSQWNNYEWLMSAVGKSISEYSHTQEYPIWGFGGDYNGQTYQLFQCGSKKKASGIQGLLEAYALTFQTGLKLGSRRRFQKVIEAAAHHANTQSNSELSYTVLLVLTPGSDSDVLAAKESIVNVEGAPLSVVFVRVPAPGQPLLFDDEKLQVYLSNRNCQRPFTTCFDGKAAVKDRDEGKIKQMILQTLTKQLPEYFALQGIQ